MTTPQDTDNYGGIKKNAEPIEDPETELAAEEYNRLAEDTAEMSRTTLKVICRFLTTTAGAPQTIVPSSGRSHAGLSSGLLPSVSKTGTGVYVITWPVNFTNPLGTVETLGIDFSDASLKGSIADGYAKTVDSGNNVVTVYVFNNSDVASDLGGSKLIQVWGM